MHAVAFMVPYPDRESCIYDYDFNGKDEAYVPEGLLLPAILLLLGFGPEREVDQSHWHGIIAMHVRAWGWIKERSTLRWVHIYLHASISVEQVTG